MSRSSAPRPTSASSATGRPVMSPWRFVVAFGVVSMLADVVYEGRVRSPGRSWDHSAPAPSWSGW